MWLAKLLCSAVCYFSTVLQSNQMLYKPQTVRERDNIITMWLAKLLCSAACDFSTVLRSNVVHASNCKRESEITSSPCDWQNCSVLLCVISELCCDQMLYKPQTVRERDNIITMWLAKLLCSAACHFSTVLRSNVVHASYCKTVCERQITKFHQFLILIFNWVVLILIQYSNNYCYCKLDNFHVVYVVVCSG